MTDYNLTVGQLDRREKDRMNREAIWLVAAITGVAFVCAALIRVAGADVLGLTGLTEDMSVKLVIFGLAFGLVMSIVIGVKPRPTRAVAVLTILMATLGLLSFVNG